MKKVLIGVAVVVVLLIGAAVIVPRFIPVDTYKQAISDQVKSATGRELAIKGDIHLSLLPRIELEVNNVTFANMPGAADPNMAKLAKLRVGVELLPLLSGEVVVDRFVLVDPVIVLEVDKSGKANWVFAKAEESVAKKSEGGASGGGGLSNLRLGDVRLVNGRLAYKDAKSGHSETVSDINMMVSLPDLDTPLKLDGSLVWKAQKIEIAASAASPRKLIEGGTTPVEAKLSAQPVKFSYKGTFTKGEPIKAGGTIALDVPSIRKLAAWTGKPLQMEGTGLGPLSITGKLDMIGKRLSFADAKIGLDAIKAEGALTIDAGGPRPLVKAKLDVDKLDLNPYLPPEAKGAKEKSTGKEANAGPTEWSNEPLDLSGLKAVDANFVFSTGAILVRKIQVGHSALTVNLKDGKLVADLNDMQLYGGKGKGQVTVNASGPVPTVADDFALTGVQAEPLLRDAADFNRLTGTMELNVQTTAKGRSQREMVSALAGDGGVKFLNGAIKGINLAAMVRNVSTAFLSKSAGEEQKTDFAELSGTFKIAKGILSNNDLKLQAPLLRLSGSGTVDLPKKTVNYRVEPKVAATTKGQGGAMEVAGVMVPVIIEGPWHDLSYKPDLEGMIGAAGKLPSKISEGAGGLVKGGTGAAKEAVSGTLDKLKEIAPAAGPTAAPAESQPAPSANPLGAVKKLFGN